MKAAKKDGQKIDLQHKEKQKKTTTMESSGDNVIKAQESTKREAIPEQGEWKQH